MIHRKEFTEQEDKARKKVIAAIDNFLKVAVEGGYNYENYYKDSHLNVIKKIACRAAGYGPDGQPYQDFNDIPVVRLNSLYGEFRKRIQKIESHIKKVSNQSIN